MRRKRGRRGALKVIPALSPFVPGPGCSGSSRLRASPVDWQQLAAGRPLLEQVKRWIYSAG